MYLFTDNELSESKWSKEQPGIWIHAAAEGDDKHALKWSHSQRNVYYIGGYQGCGCGWSATNEWDDPDDISMKAKDRSELVSILKTVDTSNSWMIVCWEGDQGNQVLDSKQVYLNKILDPSFEFEELTQYTITQHDAASDASVQQA